MEDTESTATSIDENTENSCDNPIRDTLAEGLMGLLKPTTVILQENLHAVRVAQTSLRQQIEGLHEGLKRISELQQNDINIDIHVKQLMSAKHKLVAVSTVLQNAQERITRIHIDIEKENTRRRLLLDKSSVVTPIQSPSSN